MRSAIRNPLLALSVAASFPLVALAQSGDNYQCTMDGLTRRVEVVHETSAAVPCEVRYHKDDETPGAPQTLWSAQNEAGYCEAQAQSFAARLESWGWRCTSAAEPAASTARRAPSARSEPAPTTAVQEPPADDTADLIAPSETP
jgi:hypothetical protein